MQSRPINPAPVGTFSDLVDEYLGSPGFAARASRTQGEYRKILRKLVELIGDMPLARLGGESGVEYVYALQEAFRRHPRHCNHTLAVLSLVCSFGIRRRRMLLNPVLGVERLTVQPRRMVWSHEDQRNFLTVADQTIRLALLLGLYTAQRQGDLLRLQWSQYDGRRISLTQSKTAQAVSILIMAPLKGALDVHPRDGDHVLLDHRGRPFRQRRFEERWAATTAEAGLTGLRFQDLRRTAMTRMGEASVTETEMAAVSGHSIDRSRQILQTYVITTTPMADTAIRKWAEYEMALEKQRTTPSSDASPATSEPPESAA
jgi:integrase